jgi:hypothetical protein
VWDEYNSSIAEYMVTATDLKGKPLTRYAFTSLQEAEKYFHKIKDEGLHSHYR